jgi:hypothetical protein
VKRRLSIHLYELHWRKKEKLALIKHSLRSTPMACLPTWKKHCEHCKGLLLNG